MAPATNANSAVFNAAEPSDEGACCARGGTRRRFRSLGTLGSGGNMRSPGQSGGCTGESEAGGVDFVHTSLFSLIEHRGGT
jgi:hypothetical protein